VEELGPAGAEEINSAIGRLYAAGSGSSDAEEAVEEEPAEPAPARAEEINSAIGRLYAAGSGSADAEAVEEEPAEPAPARAEEINSAIGRLYAAGRGSADTEEAEDTEAEASEASTIAEWVLGREGFDTLSLILTAAATDYLEDLSDASAEYTLFAPTDDAFNALGAALGIDVSAAVAFPDILIDILGYHIVEGAVPAEVVLTLDGQSVATVQGESVAIAVVDGSVVLNGRVTVTVTDVVTGNGVIHVVDAVLISQSTVETLASLGLTLP
jgi:uncharacterized surface protein with fasciclin (FAS1) repeats